MSLDKIIHATMDAFKQNITEFGRNNPEAVEGKLSAAKFKQLSDGLQQCMQKAGAAGLLEYLRQKDIKQSHIRETEKEYRYKGTSNKEIITMFGTIDVPRSVYGNEVEGGEYYVPTDRALGMGPDDSATLEVREMVLYTISLLTPGEATALLSRYNLCKPSRTAIQNIMNRDGLALERERAKNETAVLATHVMPQETVAIVASLDGVNVLLREPGQKKGRKKNRPGDETYYESKTSYHNAMVGSVSYYGKDEENYPVRLSGMYTARMPQEGSVLFKQDFERQLQSVEEKMAGSSHAITKVLLTDGHLMIKGYAQECPYLADYERLIDFYHVTEHLSNAAGAMYGTSKQKSQWWYTKWRTALKKEMDAPEKILRSMVGFEQRVKLSQKRSEELSKEITFFKNNRHLMNYADYIQRGLPIGSGPIEAAAKTIVKQRMCRSGMHWSVQKGQHVLTVRAYVKSGLWDKVWNHYCTFRLSA